MTADLTFDGVSHRTLDGVELLHRVSLAVPAGSVTVLAGPSGAGKSTLLRLGNRLEVPSEGSVRFDGEDIAGVDPRRLRRSIAMIFQHPVAFAGTVADNLRVAAPDVDDAELCAMLGRVGLDAAILHRIADDLSGGERQRMCIARALLTGPRVLLMDEPTSALDPAARLGIERIALDFAADGLAILWVSHDLEQISRLADRTVVIVDGRVADAAETKRYLAGEPIGRGLGDRDGGVDGRALESER